ncbi:MAG: S-layer homology domain-containing protein [Oscillospiraceae bacterium]|nr:S-layer homology domain-containing protein [Oscillospiraceae bacterium]
MKKRYFLASLILTVLTVLLVTSASATYKISPWGTSGLKYATMAGLIDKEDYIRDYTAPILREDLAELLYDAYENMTGDAPYSYGSPYTDVYNYKINALNELGIMTGTSATTFSPRKYTTRQEMAKIIISFKAAVHGRTLDLSNRDVSRFVDGKYISDWAKPYVRIASIEGVIKGYENNTFRPNNHITYEQALALIVRSGNLKTKNRPVITSPVNEQCLVTKNNIRFVFQLYGKYKLYAVKVAPETSYLKLLGSCDHNNNVLTYPYSFNTNCIYYIFAEQDGVFSEPVKVYTDSKIIITPDYSMHKMGPVTVKWSRFPGSGAYTVTVTEQRINDHGAWITPNAPFSATVPTASSYTFQANPNKKYTIQVSSGGYTSKTELYTEKVYYGDYNKIMDNFPSAKADAGKLMRTISVPVWKLKNGKKVSSTASVTVHHVIADKVKLVFQEIYNGPEKFPIKDLGGYQWRSSATSEHNYGTAIDINSNENYCIYSNGTVVGSFWKPGVSPYSIKPYGDVVRAFEKYGFTWGGDAWYSTRDYMHFSYMGT